MAAIKTLNSQAKVKQITDADKNGSSVIANIVLASYDAIVGSGAQVASGAATHTSIQAAHNYVSSGGNILVLKGTYSETVTISKTVRITGQGHSSVIGINLIFASGASFCAIDLLKITGNITLQAASSGNFLTRCWLATGSVLSDLGSGNYTNVIEE